MQAQLSCSSWWDWRRQLQLQQRGRQEARPDALSITEAAPTLPSSTPATSCSTGLPHLCGLQKLLSVSQPCFRWSAAWHVCAHYSAQQCVATTMVEPAVWQWQSLQVHLASRPLASTPWAPARLVPHNCWLCPLYVYMSTVVPTSRTTW